MTVRTIPTWVCSIGLMLVTEVMSDNRAFAQDLAWGVTPVQWWAPISGGSACTNGSCGTAAAQRSSCPNGNCAARTWHPTMPAAIGPVGSVVSRPFSTARTPYQVAPTQPRLQPATSIPSSNGESPYYEYREAPAQRRSTTFNNDDSPFYP